MDVVATSKTRRLSLHFTCYENEAPAREREGEGGREGERGEGERLKGCGGCGGKRESHHLLRMCACVRALV